ncbi:hypothetical protein ACS0PU_000385 [Formica fusca]
MVISVTLVVSGPPSGADVVSYVVRVNIIVSIAYVPVTLGGCCPRRETCRIDAERYIYAYTRHDTSQRVPVHPAFETDHRPTDHPPVCPSTSSFPPRRGAASPRHEYQGTEVHRRFHSYVHTGRTGCATYRTFVPGAISIHRQRAELGEEPAAVAAAATARKYSHE